MLYNKSINSYLPLKNITYFKNPSNSASNVPDNTYPFLITIYTSSYLYYNYYI